MGLFEDIVETLAVSKQVLLPGRILLLHVQVMEDLAREAEGLHRPVQTHRQELHGIKEGPLVPWRLFRVFREAPHLNLLDA